VLTQVCLNPFKNRSKPKLSTLERSDDEVGCHTGFDIQIVIVHQQESVRSREGDSFVAIEKGMIISQGFHQRCRFLRNRVVVPDLRTEYRRFKKLLVSQSVDPAVRVDQFTMDLKDFADGQVDSRQLLSQFSISFAELLVRDFELIYDFGTHGLA